MKKNVSLMRKLLAHTSIVSILSIFVVVDPLWSSENDAVENQKVSKFLSNLQTNNSFDFKKFDIPEISNNFNPRQALYKYIDMNNKYNPLKDDYYKEVNEFLGVVRSFEEGGILRKSSSFVLFYLNKLKYYEDDKYNDVGLFFYNVKFWVRFSEFVLSDLEALNGATKNQEKVKHEFEETYKDTYSSYYWNENPASLNRKYLNPLYQLSDSKKFRNFILKKSDISSLNLTILTYLGLNNPEALEVDKRLEERVSDSSKFPLPINWNYFDQEEQTTSLVPQISILQKSEKREVISGNSSQEEQKIEEKVDDKSEEEGLIQEEKPRQESPLLSSHDAILVSENSSNLIIEQSDVTPENLVPEKQVSQEISSNDVMEKKENEDSVLDIYSENRAEEKKIISPSGDQIQNIPVLGEDKNQEQETANQSGENKIVSVIPPFNTSNVLRRRIVSRRESNKLQDFGTSDQLPKCFKLAFPKGGLYQQALYNYPQLLDHPHLKNYQNMKQVAEKIDGFFLNSGALLPNSSIITTPMKVNLFNEEEDSPLSSSVPIQHRNGKTYRPESYFHEREESVFGVIWDQLGEEITEFVDSLARAINYLFNNSGDPNATKNPTLDDISVIRFDE